jgi:predicted RNA-binding protein associated with RNAse of E/G family
MITVIKKDVQGNTKIQYKGEIVERLANGVVIQASWTSPTKELGYTTFEPGDQFIEHYYTDRWFNIFDISSADGTHKGWYCNVAEPAVISDNQIEQVDLVLDVWVSPEGETLVLDEDEFADDHTLSDEQRREARQGLQAILQLIAARQEMFSRLAKNR